MKLVSYKIKGVPSIGAVVENDRLVIDLAEGEKRLARKERRARHRYFDDMLAMLRAGSMGMAGARKVITYVTEHSAGAPKADGRVVHWLSGVKLEAPVPLPGAIYCLAGNYQDHIEERGAKMEVQDKETPRVFMKPPATTVIAPGAKILIPPVARAIDWEGELAVVIGRKAKGVKASRALQYVAGYTVMNDVSERKLLIRKRSESRPRDLWFDWLNGKWFDTSAPQGPWIVTRDEIPDPQKLEISTFINGERRQHNSTAQMLYPVAQVIEYISAFLTLMPGDLISTGTIAGVGAATGEFLKSGDNVEVAISHIGTLRNRVGSSRK